MTQKVYAGNLSYNTAEDTLRALFAKYGEIESVSLITDSDTGRPKGFAFVEMSTEQAAQAATPSHRQIATVEGVIEVVRAGRHGAPKQWSRIEQLVGIAWSIMKRCAR